MRILHVVASMDPAGGGPPAVVSRLAAAQAAQPDRVSSVAVVSHEAPGREKPIADSLRGIPGIERVRFATVLLDLRFRAFVPAVTADMLRLHIEQADVIHLHGVWDPLLYAASAVARRSGVPYIITPHGMLDPWSLLQSKWKKKLAMAMGIRKMLARAECLHLLNQDEADLIDPLKLPTPREVIPNGLFLEEIEPRPAAGSFYQRHPKLNRQPYILFLSRLHFKKGLDFLAAAFALVAAKLPDVHLVVAGPDGGEQSKFEKLIEQSGLNARVHVVGPLYGPEKLTALVDATCFCLPSRQEGFSVAIIEALGCGVPVVISESCHFPEVAEVGAGMVTTLEPPVIADALLTIFRDEAMRQRMSTAGRALVESKLNWPVIAERTLEMYSAAKNR